MRASPKTKKYALVSAAFIAAIGCRGAAQTDAKPVTEAKDTGLREPSTDALAAADIAVAEAGPRISCPMITAEELATLGGQYDMKLTKAENIDDKVIGCSFAPAEPANHIGYNVNVSFSMYGESAWQFNRKTYPQIRNLGDDAVRTKLGVEVKNGKFVISVLLFRMGPDNPQDKQLAVDIAKIIMKRVGPKELSLLGANGTPAPSSSGSIAKP
jgi:hypothetical protein